jgi:hypothetical protein
MVWDARMNRLTPKHLALVVLVSSSFAAACGGAGGSPAATPVDADAQLETAGSLPPVRAGQYQLTLAATCDSRERTASGVLTLRPVSEAGSEPAAAVTAGEASVLWGQTDLDFGRFASCFGAASAPSGEPIHPSVLVEVLRWDGERHHQVLLVSTDASRPEGSGVAMWVDRVDDGHIGGVWSRWELMGRGEGRWEAELLRAH